MSYYPQLTNRDAVDKIAQLLDQRAATPRPLTLPELLKKVKTYITKMLRNGHTYDDVVEVLANFDVVTTASVVEAYHAGVNKVKGRKGKDKDKDKDKDKNILAEAELQIDAALAEKIIEAFSQQAEIRKGLTKSELVAQLRVPIEKMLAANYTYDDISAVMADCGVQISSATIKSYYQGKNTKSKASSKTKTQKNTSVNEENIEESKSSTQVAKIQDARSKTKRDKRLPESNFNKSRDLEKEFNL